jgi:hypothetical protein
VLADPQGTTYAAAPISLARIETGPEGSKYRTELEDGSEFTLHLSHQFGTGKGRNRVVARLTRDSIAENRLIEGQNLPISTTCSFTMDFGSDVLADDVYDLGAALIAWLSNGSLIRLAKGET